MKVVGLVIVCLLLFAVDVSTQDDAATLAAVKIGELEQNTKNLLARLQALEQRAAPTPKAKAREIRDGYRATCTARGMKLKELQIDGATGKLTLICR